jgi:hypothetical protein
MAALSLPRSDAAEITHRMQCRMRLRRLRTQPARRAFNTLATWARSGASVINAVRAAAGAWSSL